VLAADVGTGLAEVVARAVASSRRAGRQPHQGRR
jgi:hypothetical protein